ncbi:Protein lethal(2)essential for life [Eumeta japonica]|uniref:Protein lethal(2)essential for life n=1 Tax=Eumeta variegata TaxID=151549 RepID=A0A4C1URR1_EUMVA|nr:Protein lethal(2)essential for life [Eumeta japonica]
MSLDVRLYKPRQPFARKCRVRYEPAKRSKCSDFGVALMPDDFLAAVVTPQMSTDYPESGQRDLHQTVEGFVVVEGKHEDKEDEHGFISRQFLRRYALPEGCEAETVQSKLSSDGVLTIMAPWKIDEAIEGERAIPIERTGPVGKEIKEQEEPKEQKTEE